MARAVWPGPGRASLVGMGEGTLMRHEPVNTSDGWRCGDCGGICTLTDLFGMDLATCSVCANYGSIPEKVSSHQPGLFETPA